MASWKKVVTSGSNATLNSLNVNTFISASEFVGSFTGSLQGEASSVNYDNVYNKPTLISSSAQIATEISGAFADTSSSLASTITSVSSSLAGDITLLDGRLDNLEGATLVSGSSQIILQETTGNLSGSRIVGDVPSATSSSYASNADLLDGQDSSVFATTGSNSFVGNQTITGNLNVTGQFTASALTYPTADGVFGVEVLTTDGNGNLSLKVPETLYEEVKNDDIVTLPKGIPVKVTGYQGNQALVVKADASNPALMPASYVLAQNLAPQAEGLGIILGRIQNVNTAGFNAGDIIYVAPGGGYTNVRPTGSAEVQPLGFPVKIQANGSGVIMNPGVSNGLPNLTAGHLWVGNNDSVPTTIASSSFAKVNENNTFTGTQTFNNIVVNGTGSFAYIQSVTGSAKVIGDAYIILNNDLPAEPFAGIKVIDSGSTDVTASILWDGNNNHWIYENTSGSTYGAAGFLAGPRSTDIENILYPTQYKVLRSQGGDHVYDSNITDNDTNVSISIPLSVTGDITSSAVIKATGGFEGNVTGNASTATTASHANYVEYINIGNKPTLVSGSSQIDYTGLSNIPVGILSSSAQIATEISGAFDQASGSFSTRVTQLELFSSSLDSTYATDSQLTSVSSSLASSITGVDTRVGTLEGKTLISGSTQLNNSTLTGMSITGSFTGSFKGDGSQLTGISSAADWNTLSNKPAGIVSGSSQIQLTGITGTTFNTANYTFPNFTSFNQSIYVGGQVTSTFLTVNGTSSFYRGTASTVVDMWVPLQIRTIKEKTRRLPSGRPPSSTTMYIEDGAILEYGLDNNTNWTLNVTFSPTYNMNTIISNDYTVSIAVITKNGATPYYQTGFQIDGVNTTIKWLGGTAPTAGNANSTDVYNYSITKTADSTWLVYGTFNKYSY